MSGVISTRVADLAAITVAQWRLHSDPYLHDELESEIETNTSIHRTDPRNRSLFDIIREMGVRKA
jgi:hypothetical protein